MEHILVAMSGGIDSSTLALLLKQTYSVNPVHLVYGSNHNEWELEALGTFLTVHEFMLPFVISLSNVFENISSELLGGRIPEGHYNDASMKQTVVPGRNLLFISTLASLAESMGVPNIALGIHQGDHHIYPDCRPEFARYAKKAVLASTEGRVQLLTPFLNCNKTEIVSIGLELGIDYTNTRTCYKNSPTACGKCGACVERIEAFANNNVPDPIEYKA